MRIGIQTWGSEGDVRPLLALAAGLVQRSHDIEFVYTAVEGRDWVATAAGLGVRAQDVGRDELTRQRGLHQGRLEQVLGMRNPLQQVRVITELFLEPVVDEMFERAMALCARSDLVVAHFLCHPLIAAARKTSTPMVLLFTGPAAPSIEYPPLGMPPMGPLNRAAWRLLARVAGPTLLRSANSLRRRHGIPELPHMFDGSLDEPVTLLTAVSPTLFPRPADWQANHHVCGYLSLPPASPDRGLPADVTDFLSNGTPPVFMTFGSMLAVAPGETRDGARLMLDAALAAGTRTIIQAPWSQLDFRPGSERILAVERLPHELVFDRCAAIVHHAGAGTTHSATRAGRPSVLVPYVADQTFWADRLRRLGIAPPATGRRHVTARSLARQMQQAAESAGMADRARRLGEKMRAEDAVAVAAGLVTGALG